MEKLMKRIRGNMIVDAILTVIMGILFVINPLESGTIMMTIMAVVIIIGGIADIIRFISVQRSDFMMRDGLVYGLLKILLGAFVFAHPQITQGIFAYLFGIFMIIMGANNLEHGIPMLQNKMWIGFLNILTALLMIAGGFLILFVDMVTQTSLIMTIIGIVVILCGCLEILTAVVMKSAENTVKSAVKQAVSEAEAIDVEANETNE